MYRRNMSVNPTLTCALYTQTKMFGDFALRLLQLNTDENVFLQYSAMSSG